MTITQQGILILLKSAVTGKKLTLPDGFCLEDADPIIQAHSLLPLVFHGAHNCGISMQTELMRRYQTRYFKILFHHELQMKAINQIFQSFEEKGIDYAPLKGCRLKALYPQPEMRMMGDADILIRLEQYQMIRPVMKSLGYIEDDENGHEMTWHRDNIYIELHKCFFAPEEWDFYPYFGSSFDRTVWQESHRYALSPEDEFIYDFAHMTKHYRGRGIGIRHFLDLYVFRLSHPCMNEEYINSMMQKMGLLTFYHNVCRLLDVWFETETSDEITEHITQYVFSNGNWGHLENLAHSHQLKLQSGSDTIRHSKSTEFWEAVFPPAERMCYRYKILQKHPGLHPLFWPIRWVQLAVKSPAIIKTKLIMVNSLSDEKVDARREALSFVGLHLDHP